MELSRDRMNDKKEVFMRKKYVAYFALLIIVALLFSGCDAMITNAYKTMNLGQPDPAKLRTYDATTLLENSGVISSDMTGVSDDFIAAVISDPGTKQNVISKLEALAVPSQPPGKAQPAQTLIIDIEIADIGADTLIDKFNEALLELPSMTEEGQEPEVGDIIDLLIPETLQNDTTKLKDVINGLHDSSLDSEIEALAELIRPEGATENTVVENLSYGTIAQTSALILIVQSIEPASGSELTPGDAVVAALEELEKGEEGHPENFISFNKENLTDNTALPILFEAAGAQKLYDELMKGLSGGDGGSNP